MKAVRTFTVICFALVLTFCLQCSAFAETVTLPAGLVNVEEQAFYGDSSLTEVIIPSGTETIGELAFAYSGLKRIVFPRSVYSIADNAFEGVTGLTIAAPLGSRAYDFGFIHDIRLEIIEEKPVEKFVQINAKNFPDAEFRRYIGIVFDYDEDGKLSEKEIQDAQAIDCYWWDISSMKGIELFPELAYLRCYYCGLTSLDLSKNTKLEYLDCSKNNLTSLNISGCRKLKELDCSSNQLTSLILPEGSYLRDLRCGGNKLTSLDLTEGTDLVRLWCGANELTSLDFSTNRRLEDLDCSSNKLRTLNVSVLPYLKELHCGYNQLTVLDVSENRSSCFLSLSCENNNLTSLIISKPVALTSINCSNNKLEGLNLVFVPNLQNLDIDNNLFYSQSFLYTTKLESLSCNKNNFSSLELTHCSNLYSLYCEDNPQLKKIFLPNGSDCYVRCAKNVEIVR